MKKAKELLNSNGDEYDSDEEGGGGGGNGATGYGTGGGDGPRTTGGGGGKGVSGKVMMKEVEDELVDAAKESERQKLFVERQCSDYLHRLNRTRNEALRLTKSRLNENSTLMYECNDLRREVRELQRKLEVSMMHADKAERELRVSNRALNEAQTNGNGNSPSKGGTNNNGANGNTSGSGYSKDILQEIANGKYDEGDANTNRSLNMNNIYDTYSQKVNGNGAGVGVGLGSVSLNGGDSDVLSSHSDNKIPPIDSSKFKNNKSKNANINSTGALPNSAGRLLINSKSAVGFNNVNQQMSMTDGLIESKRTTKQLNTFKSNKSYLGTGNKSLADRTSDRLTNEIEMLVVQLDNSERENIMQSREMNRLKNIIRKLGGEGNANDRERSGTAGMLLGQRDAVRDGKAIVPSDTVVTNARSNRK